MAENIVTELSNKLLQMEPGVGFDGETSNLLFTDTFQDVSQNVILGLLPEAKRHASRRVRYVAQEPMLMAANMRDSKSPSYEVPKPGFKEGEAAGFRVAEHCSINDDEMEILWRFQTTTDQVTRGVLAENIAFTITNNVELLAKRYSTLKMKLVAEAFSGNMNFPIVQSDGTIINQIVPTGIGTLDVSVSAPWTNLTTTDIPSQFAEVKSLTKFGRVDIAMMNQATAEVMLANDSIKDLLCCESMEISLREGVEESIGSVRKIRILVIDDLDNEYELPDGTRALLIPDGEVFFANSTRLFGHYDMPNMDQTQEQSGVFNVAPGAFGSQFVIDRHSNPSTIQFAHTANGAVVTENPNGALRLIAYV